MEDAQEDEPPFDIDSGEIDIDCDPEPYYDPELLATFEPDFGPDPDPDPDPDIKVENLKEKFTLTTFEVELEEVPSQLSKYQIDSKILIPEEWLLVVQLIQESELGKELPPELVKLIVGFRGRTLRWGLWGPNLEIIKEDATVFRQKDPSNSAIANTVFSVQSGVHVWQIHVLDCKGPGCKYIGVVDATNIGQNHLDSNLQNGCQGRRIAFDGSCQSVYCDIDSYASHRQNRTWNTGDVVTIYLDCDHQVVQFAINKEVLPDKFTYSKKCPVVPVVGCGRTEGEIYALGWCSWPNQIRMP